MKVPSPSVQWGGGEKQHGHAATAKKILSPKVQREMNLTCASFSSVLATVTFGRVRSEGTTLLHLFFFSKRGPQNVLVFPWVSLPTEVQRARLKRAQTHEEDRVHPKWALVTQ